MKPKLQGIRSYANTWVVKDNVWELKFVKTAGDCNGNDGLCDPSIKVVYIRKGLCRGELFKTFIHEFLHAVEVEYEIEVDKLSPPANDHEKINKFERGFAEFLLQNLTAIAKILGFQ